MSRSETLQRLAEMQRRFSAVLRTPLAADGGKLDADASRYPAGACEDVLAMSQLTAAARLGIYQRQYWMRLYNVMQEQYPLTTRLLGAWFFNHYAMRFLQAHPPPAHDLARSAEGFDVFLAREIVDDPVRCSPDGPTLPRTALLEAAAVDAVFRTVFLAPEEPCWSLASAGEAALGTARLQLSKAVRCIEEHWPLLELRASSLSADAERVLSLPERAPRVQHWLVFRTERGVGHARVAPAHARLFALLSTHQLGEALALVQQECPDHERDRLPSSIRDWFAFATRIGAFTGWSST
jgi:Putative DNA-binding domain